MAKIIFEIEVTKIEFNQNNKDRKTNAFKIPLKCQIPQQQQQKLF